MARVSRLTQLSGVAVILYILAAALYMMYLIYSHYQVQDKLRESAWERNVRENEKKSLTIGYFLSERIYDLENLSESRAFLLYFENEALGMSREYGLSASIVAINDMLHSFRNRRALQGVKLFDRLVFVDNSGTIFFENSTPDFNEINTSPAIKHSTSNEAKEEISFTETSGKGYLIISIPVHFNGAHRGTLSGWIPVHLLHRLFVESTDRDNAHYNLLVFKNSYITGVDAASALLSRNQLPTPSSINSDKKIAIDPHHGNSSSSYVRAYLTPIGKTPLALASFYKSGNGQSGPPPISPYILLGGIGIALLAGGAGFYRVTMRSVALEVRLEENLAREKLVEEKNFGMRKLMTALEQSPNSIVITDITGSIEYVNPHFCKITGYSFEEVIGKTPRILKSGKEANEKYEEMWQQVLEGKTWTGEFLNLKKNGEHYWEQANIAPVCNEQGSIVSIIAIKEDITERKRVEQDMKTARLAAEAASRAKSEFLANMSHEIRTPMNGIIGMTDLCLQTQLDSQQHNYLSAVRVSAENLLTILNDILDFSKIEAGKIDLVQGPFLLRTLIGQALQTLAAKAAERNLELVFHPSPETPDALIGDPGRLKQIIINLVGNAIKFSENGQVIISAQPESENDSGCFISFSVTDSGIGIAEKHLQCIFAPFEQGDASTTKAYGGTGLGLSISKKLVELMEGTISVTSTLGVGSTFSFTARFNFDPAGEHRRSYSTLQGKSALVVDDCAINRTVLSDFLKQWGVNTVVAENASTAYACLEQFARNGKAFDILLTDSNMPGRSGWDLIADLRHDSKIKNLRTVILPSVGIPGDAGRCSELGIDGYLPKPIIHGELYELLCNIMTVGHVPQGLALPVTSHSLRDGRKRLSVLAAEDVPINQEIISALLSRHGHRVDIVQNGAEAVAAWRDTNNTYDIILMDVQMPVMDGLQATSIIRDEERKQGGHIPIVAMTAYAMKDDRERCISAGMDDYLSKPFKSEDFLQILSRYGKGVHRDQTNHTESVINSALPMENLEKPFEVFNRAELIQRIGGKSDLIESLVEMFVSLVKRCCRELAEALEQENSDSMRRSLHTLTGAAANISAHQMLHLITQLHGEVKQGNIAVMKDGIKQMERELKEFELNAGC